MKNNFFKILRRVIAGALCICAIFLGISFSKGYINPIISNLNKSKSVTKTQNGRINALVVATDKSGLRTDTIMLASIDTKRKLVNVMSIPRDTRVTIGNSKNNKINAVYASAKEGKRIDALIDKIHELTGLPINYYAVIHPDGFKKVIDVLGGVYIDVPQRMKYTDPYQDLYIDLYPGYQLLDGNKAEQFTRFRSYPTGDLGRIEAQQMFIRELFKQKVNPELILKADDLYKEITKHLDTNVTIADVPVFLSAISSFNTDAIRTFEMPNVPYNINGASYVICNVKATKELIIKEFLGIEEESQK